MATKALVLLVIACGCAAGNSGEDQPSTCPSIELANAGFDKDLTASDWIRVGSLVFVEADAKAPTKPNTLWLRGGTAKIAQVVPVPDEWTRIVLRGSWAVRELMQQPSGVPTPIARLTAAIETMDGTSPLRELGSVDVTGQAPGAYRSFELAAEWAFGGGPARLSIGLATPLDPAQAAIDNLTLSGTCD